MQYDELVKELGQLEGMAINQAARRRGDATRSKVNSNIQAAFKDLRIAMELEYNIDLQTRDRIRGDYKALDPKETLQAK